jgi:hypothetical protein
MRSVGTKVFMAEDPWFPGTVTTNTVEMDVLE